MTALVAIRPRPRLIVPVQREMGLAGRVPLLRDRFQRANNTQEIGVAETGQPWDQGTARLGITSHQVYLAGAGATIAWAECYCPDVVIEADITISNGAGQAEGLVARYQDADNYWSFDIQRNAGTVNLLRRQGGVSTNVSSGGGSYVTTLSAGQVVRTRVEVMGNHYSCWLDGVLCINYDDATGSVVRETKHGLRTNNGNARIANLQVYTP